MIRKLLSKPFTPRIGVYNGVAVRDKPRFCGRDHEPEHKQLLSQTALDESEPGDRVVVVGGGRGVVPTVLSRADRDVIVFEAAAEMVDRLAETQRLNSVSFEVAHALVGSDIEVYGDYSKAVSISPDELAGDLLVLDCEGSEKDILPVDGFESVVVETHPRFGAPTKDVQDILQGSTVVGADDIDGDVIIA